MIVFDTETTGLIGHDHIPLHEQPEIIEFAALKLDDHTLGIVDRIEMLIKPKILPLPAKIVEITHITDDMLTDAPSFARVLPEIEQFFLGERTVVAHNAPYDIGMLMYELKRLDRVTRFPWPTVQLCTVELSMGIRGARMRLGDLYTHATGATPGGWHRAMQDVEMLTDIVRWMKSEGLV
jgi:DNA polymerase-3 subunit alpha (Gram-positive type)